jgi:hypothetical protein
MELHGYYKRVQTDANVYGSTTASTRWMDFKFHIDKTPVYNACYVHVLGYSCRQLERWKNDIYTRDCKSACHGNALKPHEIDYVVVAHAILYKYINLCGCMQPHSQHFRKRDGVFIPLV